MRTIYDFTVKDRKGGNVSLKEYANEVILIVNTATKCGFTPQYEELEKLYERHYSQGFTILDFPCNQFGQQAPGTDIKWNFTKFLINKKGMVVARFEPTESMEVIEKEIIELLK